MTQDNTLIETKDSVLPKMKASALASGLFAASVAREKALAAPRADTVADLSDKVQKRLKELPSLATSVTTAYNAPRTEGMPCLVKEVQKLMEYLGVPKEQLQANFLGLLSVQHATLKVPAVQLFLLNNWFIHNLRMYDNTFEQRFLLSNKLTPELWLKTFEMHIAPRLLELDFFSTPKENSTMLASEIDRDTSA